MDKHYPDKEAFLDKLFDRFKLDKHLDAKLDRDEIDLQDFVIGLIILSRISFLDKVKGTDSFYEFCLDIFELTDLDEDGCLSLEEIQTMVERIEKIFSKENSPAKVQRYALSVQNLYSYSLLLNVARKRAERIYQQLLFLLKRNNPSLSDDDQGLITCEEFIDALKSSINLYREENFLPLNLSLFEILRNVASEPTIQIHEQNKQQFCDFRKQIAGILQNKGSVKDSQFESGNPQNNLIKYPGKVEIIRNQKVVDVLPTYEKQDKRAFKNTNASYYNTALKKNMSSTQNTKGNERLTTNQHDFKDLYDQKLAQQTLDSYKLKVKKMIETKTDPRLKVNFDREVRK